MSKSKKKNREMRSSERVTTVSVESRETRLETRKKQRKQRPSSKGIFSKPANRRNLIIAAVVLLLLAASVRNNMHVLECAKAGADIATVPYKVFKQMLKHPLTDIGIEKFLKDWESVK